MTFALLFMTLTALSGPEAHRNLPAPPPAAGPCQFGKGTAIPSQSSWYDQFACYQSSGRHVSVPGSVGFEAGAVSGGLCILGVTHDRIQIAPCGSFAGDAAMTISYSAIAYVIDDPRTDAVNIYVTPLFHR